MSLLQIDNNYVSFNFNTPTNGIANDNVSFNIDTPATEDWHDVNFNTQTNKTMCISLRLD